jgi:hypothetical protein
MPNVTLFFAADAMPQDAGLAALTDQCTALCTDLLGAAPDSVHIMYAAVRVGRGHRAYAELNYRLAPARTPAVMASFMAQLDAAIHDHAGVRARIRCFGHAAVALHARN